MFGKRTVSEPAFGKPALPAREPANAPPRIAPETPAAPQRLHPAAKPGAQTGAAGVQAGAAGDDRQPVGRLLPDQVHHL